MGERHQLRLRDPAPRARWPARRLGLDSRDAQREAERQLERSKRAFEERERVYNAQRAELADEIEYE